MIKKIGTFKDYNDNTLKSVFKNENNEIIEMSLLFNKENKDVICVPTHHFCTLGCLMCHLTNKKIQKQMLPIKYNDFITCLFKTLTHNKKRITTKKNLLISFMGVGEPLLNLKLIEELTKNESLIKKKLHYENIGYAISTMMPNNKILDLLDLVTTNNIPLKVHYSMHNPIDKLRNILIPSSTITNEQALNYLITYKNCLLNNKTIMEKYSKLHSTTDPIEIHYTLIKDVNDTEECLNKLCNLLTKYPVPLKFIKFNPTSNLKASENEDTWVEKITNTIPNLRIKRYSPPGKEVGSSCGEFTKHFYHQEIETKEEHQEFIIWKKEHQV